MKNLKRFENFNTEHTQDEMNNVWRKLNTMATKYDDKVFDLMELAFEQDRMSISDFINSLPESLDYDYEYLVSVLNQIKRDGI